MSEQKPIDSAPQRPPMPSLTQPVTHPPKMVQPGQPRFNLGAPTASAATPPPPASLAESMPPRPHLAGPSGSLPNQLLPGPSTTAFGQSALQPPSSDSMPRAPSPGLNIVSPPALQQQMQMGGGGAQLPATQLSPNPNAQLSPNPSIQPPTGQSDPSTHPAASPPLQPPQAAAAAAAVSGRLPGLDPGAAGALNPAGHFVRPPAPGALVPPPNMPGAPQPMQISPRPPAVADPPPVKVVTRKPSIIEQAFSNQQPAAKLAEADIAALSSKNKPTDFEEFSKTSEATKFSTQSDETSVYS